MFGYFKRKRRARLRQQPFPQAWRAIIERDVRYWQWLSAAERTELLGHVQIFLHEKRFEGCGGLIVTDDIRVTIAAQACLLLLKRDTDYYPKLTSILVYPASYVVEADRPVGGGIMVAGPEVRAGESWSHGTVVLSWDDTRRSAVNPHDGYNVVLHEFAHQLDAESGAVDGAPLLPDRHMYADWSRVLGAEYERLRDDLRHRRATVLRPYGATSPAEFFAVATETFFEKPVTLQQRHPELYEQLRRYYQQDPADRLRRAARRGDVPPDEVGA